MSTQASMVGKFVWYELRTSDPRRAQAFYTQLFGWKVDTKDPHYAEIQANGEHVGGIALPHAPHTPPHWITYVHVDSVDDTVLRAKRAGGAAAAEPFDVPNVGRMAVIRDPQGAHLALYKGHPPAESSTTRKPGSFCWNELVTSDPEKAVQFYGEVLGWTSEQKDMGPLGFYWVCSRGDVQECGVMQRPPHVEAPPFWIPYVLVEDCDAATRTTTELGGTVHMPTMDIPGIGRMAVIADPTGAAIAVFTYAGG